MSALNVTDTVKRSTARADRLMAEMASVSCPLKVTSAINIAVNASAEGNAYRPPTQNAGMNGRTTAAQNASLLSRYRRNSAYAARTAAPHAIGLRAFRSGATPLAKIKGRSKRTLTSTMYPGLVKYR